jgi:glycosyltransferase involved in cell wall biosynthesis
MLLANLFLRSKFYVIYDAHEYESQKMGLAKTGRLTIQFLEKVSSHFVDGFITVSGSILKKYQNIYSNNPKTLILNCPPRWNKVSKNLFRKKFKISEESLVALYQGGFMPGRAIEILAKAFQIIDVKNLDFVFMGYPASSEAGRNSFSKIMKISQEFENIHFHESVNSNILHEFTGSADLGFCLIEDLCLSYRYCLPNKFFEYAMAGLPLLVSDLPEMRKLVEQYDCGVVCESLTPDGIVNGLKKLLSRDLVKLGKNARKMAEDHSWEVQEEKLLRLYDKVLHKKTT